MSVLKKILTVTEINTILKNVVAQNNVFLDFELEGEVSNFKIYQQRYAYFSLKDNSSSIKANCFDYNVVKKLEYLNQNNHNQSLQLRIKGSLSVYVPRGEYSILVKDAEMVGKGNILGDLKALQEKLFKEGLFNQKRPIKKLPKNIGIITAYSGAALRDMCRTISRRFNFADLYLFPAIVQGEKSSENIVKKIKQAQNYDLDILIIARGGGSIEDLWSFNSEEVARAAFKSKIPTISGVGHEVDTTTIDHVVDLRAATPTAAAEMATMITTDQLKDHIKNSLEKIENIFLNLLEKNKEDLMQKTFDVQKSFLNFSQTNTQSYKLLMLKFSLLKQKFFEFQQVLINNIKHKLQSNIFNKLNSSSNKFISLTEKLSLLNPENILKKGYAIVYNENKKIVTEKSDIKDNKRITIQTASDKFNVNIIEEK